MKRTISILCAFALAFCFSTFSYAGAASTAMPAAQNVKAEKSNVIIQRQNVSVRADNHVKTGVSNVMSNTALTEIVNLTASKEELDAGNRRSNVLASGRQENLNPVNRPERVILESPPGRFNGFGADNNARANV
jgi:hypothetical protein